jgi:hypothetical protein
VTAEPTRLAAAAKPAVDLMATTLKTIEIPVLEEEPRRSRWPLFVSLAAALLLITGGTLMWKNYVGRASARPVSALPPRPDGLKPVLHTAAAAIVPVQPGHIAINAFPWGEITSVKNIASGKLESIENVVTPAPLDLAPGRYEITLSNPAFGAPIVKVVDVRAGEDQLVNVQFADPGSAKLPVFQ